VDSLSLAELKIEHPC